jgi:hypothetical protein
MIRGPKNVADYRDDDHNYVDPLPACDIADAYDGPQIKSVTTWLSIAHPFTNDSWKLGLAADHAIDNAHEIVKGHIIGDLTEIKAAIAGAPDRHRDAAANRGTEIHSMFESLMAGEELGVYNQTSPSWVYVDRVKVIVEEFKAAGATMFASEVLAFNRTGPTGQFDAGVELGGKRIIVDYKTRGETKPSAALRYPKEAAQLGAYSLADYWIVEDDTGAHRMAPFEFDGGLVISLTPDDHAYYYVDLDKARDAWSAAFAWAQAKDDTSAFARCVRDLTKIVGGEEPEHSAPTSSPSRPARIEPAPVADDWTPPAEGRQNDLERSKERLRAGAETYGLVDGTLGMKVLNGWVLEGDRGRRPWRIRDEGTATTRRLKIYGAAMRLAAWPDLTDDNAAVLVGFVLGEEIQPAMTLGMALGCLTIDQAATLAKLADLLLSGAQIDVITTATAA